MRRLVIRCAGCGTENAFNDSSKNIRVHCRKCASVLSFRRRRPFSLVSFLRKLLWRS
jgi:DNA-directed RNA polymerase subunit RPC12/RpoP